MRFAQRARADRNQAAGGRPPLDVAQQPILPAVAGTVVLPARRFRMKRHALSMLFLVSVASGAVSAQSAPAPAAPDPAPAAPYQKVVEGRTVADYAPPSRNDPRVCLEFATNAQVIACAEKYRPDRRRAQ